MQRKINEGVQVNFDIGKTTQTGSWIDVVGSAENVTAIILYNNRPQAVPIEHVWICPDQPYRHAIPEALDDLGRAFQDHEFTPAQRSAFEALVAAVAPLR